MGRVARVVASWRWGGGALPYWCLPPREEVVRDREEAIRMIRGMALGAAAAIARDDAVRTAIEVKDEFDPPELLKLRIFMGQRSTVVAVPGMDLDHVLSDAAVRQKVERQISAAVAGIAR
jgi:hypothetical protein